MSLVTTALTIKDVELEAVRRILELDGSAFDQARTKGVWKEALQALVVEGEAHPRGHLAFNVFAESGRNTGRQRDRHNDTVRTQADVAVLFMFHMRPARQVEDGREAAVAAQNVVAALLAEPQHLMQWNVVNSWRPATLAKGEWMLVRLDFTCDFDLSLLRRAA